VGDRETEGQRDRETERQGQRDRGIERRHREVSGRDLSLSLSRAERREGKKEQRREHNNIFLQGVVEGPETHGLGNR
jgi:hypothetical protein